MFKRVNLKNCAKFWPQDKLFWDVMCKLSEACVSVQRLLMYVSDIWAVKVKDTQRGWEGQKFGSLGGLHVGVTLRYIIHTVKNWGLVWVNNVSHVVWWCAWMWWFEHVEPMGEGDWMSSVCKYEWSKREADKCVTSALWGYGTCGSVKENAQNRSKMDVLN